MSDLGDRARAMYRAYADGDRTALETLIADDFHFTSPRDNRIDRQAYFKACWPNNDRISDFDFIRVVEDRETVFVTYEGVAVDGRRFRNSEVLTFKDGQVTDVEVYFGWSLPHDLPLGQSLD